MTNYAPAERLDVDWLTVDNIFDQLGMTVYRLIHIQMACLLKALLEQSEVKSKEH